MRRMLVPMLKASFDSGKNDRQMIEHLSAPMVEAGFSALAMYITATCCVQCFQQLPMLEALDAMCGTDLTAK